MSNNLILNIPHQSRISRQLGSAFRDGEILKTINMRKTHIIGVKSRRDSGELGNSTCSFLEQVQNEGDWSLKLNCKGFLYGSNKTTGNLSEKLTGSTWEGNTL